MQNYPKDEILQVKSSNGSVLTIGDVVSHDDKEVGTATVQGFRISEKHAPDIEALTDKGTGHIAFLYPVEKI